MRVSCGYPRRIAIEFGTGNLASRRAPLPRLGRFRSEAQSALGRGRLPRLLGGLAAGAILWLAADAGAADIGQPLDLQAIVDRTLREGGHELRLPSGTWRVAAPAVAGGAAAVTVKGAHGLTIDGAGATVLVFSSIREPAILVGSGSERVTLRGFAIDYDPLPFTQGRVTAVSPDGASLRFALDDGYPSLWRDQPLTHAYVFDAGPAARWKDGVPDLYPRRIDVDAGGRNGRLTMASAAGLRGVAAGDRVVLNVRTVPAIRIGDLAADTRIEDVEIRASPGAAIIAHDVRGENYFRFRLVRGPRPPGAAADRLLSVNADGLHYATARRGPIVEGSEFSFQGDDGINLHGPMLPVLAVEGQRRFVTVRPGGDHVGDLLTAGDPVRLLTPGSFAVLGSAALIRYEPIDRPAGIADADLAAAWPSLGGGGQARPIFYRVTLAGDLAGLRAGAWADLPALAAPGYTIRGNLFHDHRARGLRIDASHGLIEDNRFERVRMNAIVLGPEYARWREAGWVEDVTVRGNRITGSCTDPALTQPSSYAPGAIAVGMEQEAPALGLPYARGNRAIRIERNEIDGCAVSGIFLNAADDVTLAGNRIANVNRGGNSPPAGAAHRLDAGRPVSVNDVGRVEIR